MSLLPLLVSGAGGCFVSGSSGDEGTVILTVENRSGADLWHFQYAGCGSNQWTEVIGADEYVPDGGFVTSADLYPGCYDLYVEDEFGCVSQTSAGDVGGGLEFTWTLYATDLYCYYYY